MLNLLKKYEEEYARDAYQGSEDGDFYRFDDRGSRLVLTAPHAVRTFRNQKPKAPDLYTGALARLAGEQSGVSAIIRRRFSREKNSVTNFISDRKLERHWFLDIHGMNGSRGFELAVGTGILPAADYAGALEKIGQLAEKYRISWVVNHPDYTGKFGLTGDLQRLWSAPRILQLEWRLDLRDFYHFSDHVINRTLPFIAELVLSESLFAG